MRMVPPAQMAEIDRRAQEEYFLSGLVLMENAGIKGFLRYVELSASLEGENLLFVAGGGNNGGDALVMARQAHLLLPKTTVRVILAKKKLNEPASTHAAAVKALGIGVAVWEEEPDRAKEFISQADRIFDGIAGTGLKGALRAPLDSLVELLNGFSRAEGDTLREMVAIDVPSGIGEGFSQGMPAIKADLTLTMGLPKTVLYTLYARPCCGRIETIALGFPPALLSSPEDSGELVEEPVPRRAASEAYKGSRGHTAVFAGAVGTTGAAGLSSGAAAAAGSGLVTLHCDCEIYPFFAGKTEGVMVRPCESAGDVDLGRYSAVVAGPGWGGGRGEFMELLLKSGLPGIADADALRAAGELMDGALSKRDSTEAKDFFGGNWVLTPHPGEFSLLSEIPRDELFMDPIAAVREAAQRLGAVVLLKAHVCYIAAPDGRYSVIDGMNPAMGTGGSGDVLSGTVGGLLAGGIDPYSAAVQAAAVHQAAGRGAAEKSGWFKAEELTGWIAKILYHGGADV